LMVLYCDAWAQQIDANVWYTQNLQRELLKINNGNLHSDIYPLYISEIPSELKDTLYKRNLDTNYIELMPYLDNWAGVSSQKQTVYQYGLGATASIHYKKWNSRATFFSQGGKYPAIVDSFYVKNNVFPSQGIVFTKDTSGYVLQNFSGYVSYQAGKYFLLEAGHGKNFIGDGYRSVLLSDFTHNYSYFKILTNVWHFKYLNLYGNLKNYHTNTGDYFQVPDKFFTIHYLSWKITRRWTGGFFESVVWGGQDSLLNRKFDINYLNPVIFYRPVEYSIGSSDNSLMGLNTSYKISNKCLVYGQFLIDEFLLSEIKRDVLHALGKGDSIYGWVHNKYAAQIGMKVNDIFTEGLFFQAEYNIVRPFTYGHYSTATNYGHFNQSLAHPWGANFKEIVFISRYLKKRWIIEAKAIFGRGGVSSPDFNAGENINNSYLNYSQYHGNVIGQGNAYVKNIQQITVNYRIADGLVTFANVVNYQFNTKKYSSNNEWFFTIGVSSALFNRYWDF
ncbi:MAG: hypothetical protein D6707_03050, partial [Bacteroidetes bacterium]